MSRKSKKGSKAFRAKISRAQKAIWEKRRQAEVVPKAQCEEFSPSKWINAADTPKERQLRKAAMHATMYSGGSANEEGLLRAAGRIRDQMAEDAARKERLAEEGIKFERWNDAGAAGAISDKWSAQVGYQQSNLLKSNPKTLTGQQKVPILSVVPPASIIAQATAMRYGAFLAPKIDGTRGYGPYNWRDQPIEAHIYIDAAMRHLMQWWDGDEREVIVDDQGNQLDMVSHLAFALATIGILLDAQVNKTLIDDRPKVNNKAASSMLSYHKISRNEK